MNLLDDWVSRDAPRLDADNDTLYDEPSPAIMDALFKPLAQTVLHGRLGDLVDDVDSVRGLGSLSGESYVDKDLRTLLGDNVKGRFNLKYCGNGSLNQCSSWLWYTLHVVGDGLAKNFNNPDPAKWIATASRTGFQPGLIPNTMRTTNRPTFQQVLEFQGTP